MNASNHNSSGVSLVVRGLRKNFDGQEVLKGVDFEVRPGEIFVIMGPSGSGKSVLLKHLIGLEEPDAGEILINGETVGSPEVAAKYRMALVFQSGALLNSLTVGENVGLYLTEHRLKPPAEIEKVVAEILEDVGLKDTADKMPNELSGGMKKRVAIARALVIEPQLILYDEPTSELDPLSSVVIGNEILDLKRRTHVTSLIVSHDRDLAFGVADRIAVIVEGRTSAEEAGLAPVADIRTVAIASDHTGGKLRQNLVTFLRGRGLAVQDLGTDGPDPVDYPDVAASVGRIVARREADAGIVIDGAGIGSAIAANKIDGIRAVMATSELVARYSREHNGANVLTLGATLVTPDEARAIITTWLTTAMREPRYIRRLAKIRDLERG